MLLPDHFKSRMSEIRNLCITAVLPADEQAEAPQWTAVHNRYFSF